MFPLIRRDVRIQENLETLLGTYRCNEVGLDTNAGRRPKDHTYKMCSSRSQEANMANRTDALRLPSADQDGYVRGGWVDMSPHKWDAGQARRGRLPLAPRGNPPLRFGRSPTGAGYGKKEIM